MTESLLAVSNTYIVGDLPAMLIMPDMRPGKVHDSVNSKSHRGGTVGSGARLVVEIVACRDGVVRGRHGT